MKFLQKDGSVVVFTRGNANADMSGITSARKRKFIFDTSKLRAAEIKKIERILARRDMRKQLAEMKRSK